MKAWLKTLFDNVVCDDSDLGISFYLPEIHLGIEHCDLQTHNENSPTPKLNSYHLKKMRHCNAKGITLITVFEDEWLTRNSQVKNFLLSKFNKNAHTIYGRKTITKEVQKKEANLFMEENHIQGATGSIIAYGLYYNDLLIGVMTGNKHHRQGHEDLLVLNRLAFKDGYSVTGGSSKLLKSLINYGRNNGFSKIISWSDNRWSEGNVYEKLGFSLEEELPPDYSYVKGNGRTSKQSCKKSNLSKIGATGNTEKEMALSIGLYRIWDCGKKRWEIDLHGF